MVELYNKTSKHSGYQMLPNRLSFLLKDSNIKIKSRYEKERLAYIISKIEVEGKNILDIGGNTGYFSFELIDRGAKLVEYYEGNKEHAEFVKEAAKLLNLDDRIIVNNCYLSFDTSSLKGKEYDIALLLNVLHHYGDDYGDKKIQINEAKKEMIKQLNKLAYKAKILVFQLGFNWKGDISNPLFRSGSKAEMISFVKEGIRNHWGVLHVGIAEETNNGIEYRDLNDKNIERKDNLGEFLNRPIFILKSSLY